MVDQVVLGPEETLLAVSADRTPHESLLPELGQSAEPQLLGLLLIHEQLQEGRETTGQQPTTRNTWVFQIYFRLRRFRIKSTSKEGVATNYDINVKIL